MTKSVFRGLLFILAVGLSTVASAGEFEFKSADLSGVWYSYTGYVDSDDCDRLHNVMLNHPNQIVFITINSGGGSAFGGLALFWEAEMWPNLVTIAGKDFGAWSAAALFWMGSPRDWFEGAQARVGFHQAYCNSWMPPGCDISPFRARLVEAFDRAGYCGPIFDDFLTDLQATWGVQGWILLTDDGWKFHHSVYKITTKINPSWEIK